MTGTTPRERCGRCGEWLPHFCAAEVEVTSTRAPGTGAKRREIKIKDRDPRAEERKPPR